ncbi:MAG: aspartate kinase [Bacteroidota bacterium]
MKVFKFGGASVKEAEGIRNLGRIVSREEDLLVVVVSALGKTTNALEELLPLAAAKTYTKKLETIQQMHLAVVEDLFDASQSELAFVRDRILEWFTDIDSILQQFQNNKAAYYYDQVVSFGELLSTFIVSEYLKSVRQYNEWVDIREHLITDRNFKEGALNWEISGKQILQRFSFRDSRCYVTQGFIGGSEYGESVTLGREGSDYTGAILANVLNASSLTIWKDVAGVLNADPRYFEGARLLKEIAYHEAVELAYFGAKVIHPKTIKPLYVKNIPLYVRCFLTPEEEGTLVHQVEQYHQQLPILILKTQQVLITLKPRSFSFVMEDSLSRLFHFISRQRIKVNLIQNSAVSISICVDAQNGKVDKLLNALEQEFSVRYNENLELLTVRHYTQEVLQKEVDPQRVLVEQKSRHTAHYVLKSFTPGSGQ